VGVGHFATDLPDRAISAFCAKKNFKNSGFLLAKSQTRVLQSGPIEWILHMAKSPRGMTAF
jgi:hypothetical protein